MGAATRARSRSASAATTHALAADDDGTWSAHVAAQPGDDYVFVLDGKALAGSVLALPAGGRARAVAGRRHARFEIAPGPELGLDELVLYELHIGTFSPEGTFDGAIPRLRGLRELGITAVEPMPVATFPGNRNWGYDGLYTFAPHPAYGGPRRARALRRRRAPRGPRRDPRRRLQPHRPRLRAIAAFGPYFTDRHDTFWGAALDYSQRGVREWAIQNAELWTRDYRIDGLRLDAVHAIYDDRGRTSSPS